MANYFSHDSNARSDNKVIALRMKYGWEGYGLYFALIEKLADSPCYKLPQDYNALAYDLRTDNAKIKNIVNDFGLFDITEDGEYFYSKSLLKRMQFKDEKSAKARESANRRWEKKKNKLQSQSEGTTDAMRTQCDCNANAYQNLCERNANKKEIKGKENIAIAFPSNEAKASFPSNEEKAAAICACEEVEVSGNPGNGGLGGSSETLAAEADSANGFGNLSPDALVAGTEPEEETITPEASQPDKIPYQEIVDMFNSICTGYPRAVKLSDSRKNKIRIRVEEMGGFARAKPMIQTIFEKMQASKFLRGDGKSGWKAYFDWVFVNDKNWVKILEGNYDNKISDNEPNTGATGTMGAIPYARQAAGDKAASREAVGQFARAVLEQYKSKTGD